MTKKEIAKKEEMPVANTQPLGFDDGDDSDDLIIPRAKLIQQMSPEIADEVTGIKVGDIINSITKEPLPATFIPIFKFKNWMRFNARKANDAGYDSNFEPGAMMWRSDDPNDPNVIAEASFGPNGEKPLATTYMNFLAIFEGLPMPIIVSFANTSYKAGKQLYSMAKFAGVDMFKRKYTLGSKKEAKDDMKYYILTTAPAGICTDEEAAIGLGMYNKMRKMQPNIKVHDENDEQVTRAKDEVYAVPVEDDNPLL